MDQRKSERLDVEGTILCLVGGRISEDRLADLSLSGCRLLGVDHKISEGTELDLTLLAGVTAKGVVRWSRNGSVGIEFGEELSTATLRYFTLDRSGQLVIDNTLDTFGRKLPPLQKLDPEDELLP
ncbi:PilZ domain-containing protein [Qipengyuania vesicularis]|uniref:PilZ domain-containing protein n=1 Tax=Qipengyuania vesicularis TaxID=2867232 RepID=UPI001C86E443|nr:PilZ domain-containing protein [Qipengyuania vesicularis]MBX7528039.1 PilZ domain-containing protein [Qipengyuania vesicularis]